MQEEYERYYALLGVTKHAGKDEIKFAYRQAVKKWHPDIRGESEKAFASEMLKKLNIAYHALSSYLPAEDEDTEEEKNPFEEEIQYNHIRSLLNRGKLAEADALLNSSMTRDGQWFYLKGLIKARLDSAGAEEFLQTAVSCEPQNWEYQRELRYVQKKPKGVWHSIIKFIDDAFDI